MSEEPNWYHLSFPCGSDSKCLPTMRETRIWSRETPWRRKTPGEGNGNPLQHSCLENSMDGGASWATVHRVAKSRIRLSNLTNWYLEFSLCGVLFCLGPCPMNYGSLPLVSLNYGLLLLNSGNSPVSSWTSVLAMQPGNSMETGQ